MLPVIDACKTMLVTLYMYSEVDTVVLLCTKHEDTYQCIGYSKAAAP